MNAQQSEVQAHEFDAQNITAQLIHEISECDANAIKRLIIDKLVEEDEKARYIKLRPKDKWFINNPKHYEVVRQLYDIFTRGDELYQYTRYDIMCGEIICFIEADIEDFAIKYGIITKCLNPLQLRLLARYYSEFADAELYNMCQALSTNNKHKVEPRILGNRYKMCEYITTYIGNYIYAN